MTEILEFEGIEILESEYNKPTKVPPNGTDFVLNSGVELKFKLDEEFVFSIITIDIKFPNTSEILGRLKANCVFKLSGLKTYQKLNEGKQVIELPKPINNTILRESIATIRGVMFSEFKGTYLQNLCLPLFPQVLD